MEQYIALFTLTETGRFLIIYSNGHMK